MDINIEKNLMDNNCKVLCQNDKMLLYKDLILLSPLCQIFEESFPNAIVFVLHSSIEEQTNRSLAFSYYNQLLYNVTLPKDKNILNHFKSVLDLQTSHLIGYFTGKIPVSKNPTCLMSVINKKDILDTKFYEIVTKNSLCNFNFYRIYIIHGVLTEDIINQFTSILSQSKMAYSSLVYNNLMPLQEYYNEECSKLNLESDTAEEKNINSNISKNKLLDDIFNPELEYNRIQIESLIQNGLLSVSDFNERLEKEIRERNQGSSQESNLFLESRLSGISKFNLYKLLMDGVI